MWITQFGEVCICSVSLTSGELVFDIGILFICVAVTPLFLWFVFPSMLKPVLQSKGDGVNLSCYLRFSRIARFGDLQETDWKNNCQKGRHKGRDIFSPSYGSSSKNNASYISHWATRSLFHQPSPVLQMLSSLKLHDPSLRCTCSLKYLTGLIWSQTRNYGVECPFKTASAASKWLYRQAL